MPDNIEIGTIDGQEVASFVSFREPAWHNLGTVLDEEVNTEGMLSAAHLDNWNVRVEEVDIPEGYYSHKDQYRTVRTSPFDGVTNDILGYVGERYKPFQNEELFAFGDTLLDGGRWETGGSIKNGTKVFGSLALDRETILDPDGVTDKVNNYLLVATSHDGSAAITASVTPVRVVCANTLNIALQGAKQTFKIRHTQSMQGKVQAAREALALTDTYIDLWEEEMTNLLQTSVTNIQFDALVKDIYAPNDTKAGVTRFDKRYDAIWDIWVSDTIAPVFGTAYGAYNALNEELMWNRNGRGDNSYENVNASRAGFNPIWNAENNNLLKAVKALATV
jgi:phage/plasmid-like protein (TIGR03299 family)